MGCSSDTQPSRGSSGPSPATATSNADDPVGTTLPTTSLTVSEASRLAAEGDDTLLLDGLRSLSPEVARELALHMTGRSVRINGRLSLSGLTTITRPVAEALAGYKRDLYLDGLTTLAPDAAAALARHEGEYNYGVGLISLNGLTTLPPDSARALATHQGAVSFGGLKELDIDVAQAFASYEGPLYLDGLTVLSEEVAAALAKHSNGVSLDGLITLSVGQAHAFANQQGRISLRGLKTLAVEAADALKTNPKIRLPSQFSR